MKTRTETDSFGPIEVPADHYWGAQTAALAAEFPHRRRTHAAAADPRAWRSSSRPPPRPIAKLGVLDAAARARRSCSRRRSHRRQASTMNFPLRGLADRLRHADQHERQRGDRQPRQRNAGRPARRQEPGASQRSRQSRPILERQLPDRDAHRGRARRSTIACVPALTHLHAALAQKAEEFADIVKIGRTHLQDAMPLTLGQEFSGYAAQVELGIARVEAACRGLYRAGAGRHGGRHRPEHQPRFRRSSSPARSPAITGLPFVPARATNSRRWPRTTRWSFATAR